MIFRVVFIIIYITNHIHFKLTSFAKGILRLCLYFWTGRTIKVYES